MFPFFRRIASLFFCLLLAGMLIACGKEEEISLNCPFTTLTWDSTVDDVIAAEGTDYSTYDSIYGGLCYTWSKEYENHTGTIKYMFNGENRLVNIAWAYSAENAEELTALYDTINASVNDIYGESGYEGKGVGNYGNVWHPESGDIILSVMISSELSSLQYAYMHPSISNPPAQS